jgi:restriction system protein
MAKWTVEHLLKTDPQDFEVLLSQLFSKMGYHTELTQYSRDKGIDLVIRIENFGLVHTWNVQAKRYSNPVGVKDIREYSSIRYRDHVDGVIIVTSSSFTKEAIKEAEQHNLKLINGYLLVEMLNYYALNLTPATGNIDEDKHENQDTAAILKRGEGIMASEIVRMRGEKYTFVITNKNIFFKSGISGFLSRKEEIHHRIDLKDLIGLHVEKQNLFLITGQKKILIYPFSAKRNDVVLEAFEQLRPIYMRGEHLILSSRKNSVMNILTNKRLIQIDITDGTTKTVAVKNIINVELEGGLFKKNRIFVSESSNGVMKHSLGVDDASVWKAEIENIVRVC